MFKWHVLAIVVGIVAVSSAALAWLPNGLYGPSERVSLMTGQPSDKGTPRVETISDAMRTIRSLEARSLKRHEQLLEDTQVLADIYDGLVQQNADRVAEIAALKKEVATIRAEVAAMKAGRR